MIVRFSEACILHATLKAAEMAIAPCQAIFVIAIVRQFRQTTFHRS